MSVNSKMTAIADKIRTLLGLSGAMGLDAMATNVDTANSAVTAALTALTEKGVTVPDGTNVTGLAELIAAVESGGGGGNTLWDGSKFTMGSFTLSEDVTSEYVIATSEDDAILGLLNEGELFTRVYDGIGVVITRKPTSSYKATDYARCMLGAYRIPIYFGSGSGSFGAVSYTDAYGNTVGANSALTAGAQVTYSKLSIVFDASRKGQAGTTYEWLAWRCVI